MAATAGMFKAKGVDSLQNVDVKGKTVVLYSDGASTRFFPVPLPKGITQADFTGKRGEDWIDPMTYAKQKGAVGVIIVASNDSQKDWERLSKVPTAPRPFVEKFRNETPLPTVVVSQKVGDAMFANAQQAPYRMTGDMPKSSTAAFALNSKCRCEFQSRGQTGKSLYAKCRRVMGRQRPAIEKRNGRHRRALRSRRNESERAGRR